VRNKDIYAFKYGNGRLIGKEADIKNKIIRPFWDRDSKSHSFHVDLFTNFQIGGKDDFSNFWLVRCENKRSFRKGDKKGKGR